MLEDGRRFLVIALWTAVPPDIAIMIAVLDCLMHSIHERAIKTGK